MHDGVAQDLSALGFVVDAGEPGGRERDPDAAQVAAQRAQRARPDDQRHPALDRRPAVPARSRARARLPPSPATSRPSGRPVTSRSRCRSRSPRSVLRRTWSRCCCGWPWISWPTAAPAGGATARRRRAGRAPPQAALRMDRTGGGGREPDQELVEALSGLGGDLVVNEPAPPAGKCGSRSIGARSTRPRHRGPPRARPPGRAAANTRRPRRPARLLDEEAAP